MQQHRIAATLAMTALAGLAGCAATDAGLAQPPRSKPATFSVRAEGPTADTSTLASVSSKSGEMLILEQDGSVTKTRIDSASGRAAIGSDDAGGMRLQDVLIADDTIILEDLPKPPRAQDLAVEAFTARTRPALPARIKPTPPEAFLDTRVVSYAAPGGKAASGLVGVLVNLQRGVDETAAFAYATCTLAAWSKGTGTPYARHIRTVSRETENILAVEAIFTMSAKQPLGLRVMEQQQTLRDCKANAIPARVTTGPKEGTEKNG